MPCDYLSLALSFTLPSLYASALYSFKAPPTILAGPLKSYHSLFVERALDKNRTTLLTPQHAVYLNRISSSAAAVEESPLDLPLLNSPREDKRVSVEVKSVTVGDVEPVLVEEMVAPPLVVLKDSSASSDDDEDLLPSSFSHRDFALSSATEDEQIAVETKSPVVEIVRSSAYEIKLAILDGWLDFTVQYTPHLPSSSAFSAARGYGLAFILSEEKYELRYDYLRGTAQGPDEDDYRPELYKVQPVSSRPFVRAAVEAANSYLCTSASLDNYFSSPSTDLPLETLISLTTLHTAFSRPRPRQSISRDRSLHRDGDNAPLLHLVLYEEARRVEMRRNAEAVAAASKVLEGTSRVKAVDEEEEEGYVGEVQIRLVLPPSPPPSSSFSSSSSSTSFSWSDEDEEDDEDFFASPPVFDDDEVKEGKKVEAVDHLFSEAAPFSFYPPPSPSPISVTSSSNVKSSISCWADDADEEDFFFFSSPPTYDD
ncbi:hypothetical protein JCM8547_004675 [Rhodosporidiobolus lusitaniae]